MKMIDAWRYWCRPAEAPAKSAQMELPLNEMIRKAEVELYRSGRWHLRDGNRFGRPPYYGKPNPKTGNLRLTDKR